MSFDEQRGADTGLLDSGFGFEEVDFDVGEPGEEPGWGVGERAGAAFLAEVTDVDLGFCWRVAG